MPINENGMNSDFIKYFSLEEYSEKIKLSSTLLSHLDETTIGFDKYIEELLRYDEKFIIKYWMNSLYEELRSSNSIENIKFNEGSLLETDLLFNRLTINHKKIYDIHNFVVKNESPIAFEYRKVPVNVSRINPDNTETIFWRGANPEDVYKFMNDFINIYKLSRTSLIYSNPFLSSSLMHLLFDRIHPFTDGNGRTARIIHNLKFTEGINKIYGTKLKLSPLNLSSSILRNKITYVKRINNIYFDLEHNTNEAINAWFEFCLDMADEQIYYQRNMLMKHEETIKKMGNPYKIVRKLSRWK